MPRKTTMSSLTKTVSDPSVVERTFVAKDDDAFIKITSDERGDEAVILPSKLKLVNSVTVEGVAEKEPILLVHFEGGGAVQVTFNSRTNVFKARQQLLDLLKQHVCDA